MENGSWANRVTMNSDKWNPLEQYNHRNILDNEVVVEFDSEETEKNGINSAFVVNKLKKLGMEFSVWYSGNKSVHVHAFFDIKHAADIRLIKRCIMMYLTEGCDDRPDYQLAIRRHLIRAEYGLHEKSLKLKSPITETPNYPKLNKIPDEVWRHYDASRRKSLETQLSRRLDQLEASPLVQKMLDTITVRMHDDGRERILFVLIHVLKVKYKEPEDLADFLYGWYKYTNGRKFSKNDLLRKVKYHFNRSYNITEKYLKEVLEDVGIE
jgi:hypothetical protein